MTAAWRTMRAAEEDYVRDLATRWASWSYIAAGGGLVLAIIAASMRGYAVPGFAQVSAAVSLGLAGTIGGTGLVLCGVLQSVARRLRSDLALARVDTVAGDATATAAGKYVTVAAAGTRFLHPREDWERRGLPLGAARLELEVTAVTRVILCVNGSPVYA